ncbi:S41 family peptidase [Tenacibaculum maritimum]|uniref:Peptidase family S41 n=1 Tax=Tenacibaculum maritimum NCIMB 2154 TaxID=1349785 RepID=A0A2H1E693_9FLAO|nr:S41 family peptidase [Tenacibaculum maritimum]CAA0174019.1 Probable membrane associated S41A family C-terminal processing peptidase [Tenacibaculum maritimum]CAA0176471.1 Probable membrane associated S41A family C-terminal processing peptidase [Tenacibaculum maritimum]CAA0179699.1 Probable membrane associated S41A family C-terminal processing peptidase [Tenacibaculum maritimum]CAA0181030.1 Probable membrane associated S41A family C-terminal processing peptidase [Tenacibaculum maritimum]CAA01
MNKNNLPIYLSIAIVIGILIGYLLNLGQGNNLAFSPKSSKEIKIKRLIDYIQHDYVDTINTDSLLDDAITNMLEKLDPHSVYIPKENLQAVTENMQGNFVGIGVQFRMNQDSIMVIHPIKNGPSIKAGIKAGDRILLANKDTLYGKGLRSNQILNVLKGNPNTNITLQIYRKTIDSLFEVEIQRGKVNIKSVDVAYMLNDSIGYIKLDRFARNTYKEFKNALNSLLNKGMTDLVLDLRGNGGGFIDIANQIVDEFLEDGKLIVFTKNNKGRIHKSFATEKGDFENGGLYVLIDQNSASASEIVAGALQDNDKGTIIGRRSFGKGLVQEEMELGDGSAVRLTTARYYTPTGRSIQKQYKSKNNLNIKGFANTIEYSNDIQERYENGELFHKDSIKIIDSLKFTTPKGKIVYGGGGIVPDVFIPIDTTNYIQNIYFRPINEFTFDYVDRNRKELSKLSIEDFIQNFDHDNSVSTLFVSKLGATVLSPKLKRQLKKHLKTLVASELFSDEGLYRVNQLDDKMIQKVFTLEAEKSKKKKKPIEKKEAP